VNLLLAIVVGFLVASGVFLLLRRSVLRVVLGLAVLSHAANLLIFAAGGVTRAVPPIVPEGLTSPPNPHADPLPQALVLTAIVISFGVLAFLIVLTARSTQATGHDDTDAFKELPPTSADGGHP
jgi:multicomponent Na+:H+ antiporter subunit C